ncbi:MAG TPA: protein translocase subunit SecD [Gemmatimonadota bacterium]|nr:protein translocase subunit SecD [Gemmatimonadota bacterium]
MRHDLRIRWIVVAAFMLAALWYLWPTFRLYSMAPAERAEMEREDPAGWESLRGRAIQLGLDLQGGMHLVLELDESERAFTGEERTDAVDRALEIIRNRVDQFGVAEPLIQKVGAERIIVELPGIQDEERAKELVQRTAYLEFQIVADADETTEAVRELDEVLAGAAAPDTAGQAAPDTTGGAGATDTTAADTAADTTAADTTAADTTAADTPTGDLGDLLGEGAQPLDTADQPSPTLGEEPLSSLLTAQQISQDDIQLYVEERQVAAVRAMLENPAAVEAIDEEWEWLWGTSRTFEDGRTYRELYLVEREAGMTGEAIATAAATYDPQNPTMPIVTLDLTSEGGETFSRVTGQHVNERMAIVLDEVVRMAPNINQRITGGQARIEGFDSIEEARDIAIVLRAGALPAPLDIIEERTVGPSLGADSIERGWKAGLLGLIVVVAFMVFYYRGAGLVANVALALNIALILAALAAFGATLTLPGIAGLILTVGMAVDANVLVFERIREELDLGKTVRASIDAGYDRAFVTILDAQITTLIAAAVLFQFGTGPIKGFAVVLSVGIISSIFTAVFVTRTIFETWARSRPATKLSI